MVPPRPPRYSGLKFFYSTHWRLNDHDTGHSVPAVASAMTRARLAAFTVATIAAAKQFQTRHDLIADGIVDPLTLAALNATTQDTGDGRRHRAAVIESLRSTSACRRSGTTSSSV